MTFSTDKQTLDDLNILGKYRPGSVFSLFNRVVTPGGERLLEEMFRQPLTDYKEIGKRTGIFKYFTDRHFELPFSASDFGLVEEYLAVITKGNRLTYLLHTSWKKIAASFLRDAEYATLHKQLLTSVRLLHNLEKFLAGFDFPGGGAEFFLRLKKVFHLLQSGSLKWVAKFQCREELTLMEVAKYDHLLRTTFASEMQEILRIIYELDVYITGANVARAHKFCLAYALPRERNIVAAIDLKHPCLSAAVGNDIALNGDRHLVFLTGANMAGKSTFMKSFGIAIYLAHIGFPIAAKGFSFSVKDGLYTSINVSDNLNLGYSHFYAEVMRVKKVALEIERPLSLYIIFDELFKGTNVKDAYDATFAITSAFTAKQNCFFVISTHITETGDQLRKMSDKLLFVYFPSLIRENGLEYPYKLQSGISEDKHGMMIIRKEKILEMINGEKG